MKTGAFVDRLIRIVGTSLVLLCACSAMPASPAADGGIHSFRADITVNEDATLEIREELSVNSAGIYFKYGLMRFLPISSNERWDRRYVGEYRKDNGIRVRILELTQDGQPVKYEQGSGYGYSQLRIGEKNVPLAAGDHLYVIRYTVAGGLNLGTARDTL